MNLGFTLLLPILHQMLQGPVSCTFNQSIHKCQVIGGFEMEHILRLMDLSHGSSVIILQDRYMGKSVTEVIDSWTIEKGVVRMSVSLSEVETFIPHLIEVVIKKKNLSAYRSMLNFVVFCDDCILNILNKVSIMDSRYGKGSLLRHFSKWLFINIEEVKAWVPFIETDFDNVAVVYKMVLNIKNTNATDIHISHHCASGLYSAERQGCSRTGCISIHTLLWKPTGRKWSHTGYIFHQQKTPGVTGLLFPNVQYGLNGRELKFGAMEWTTFCKKVYSADNTSISFSHVCRDVSEYLGNSLNFTYVFIEPSDKSWGEKLPNSSWSGLLGMVLRNEVDLSIIPYGITLERQQVMSFSAVIISSAYQVSYRKTLHRSDWVSLVTCFKWDVYVCGLIAFIWCVGLLVILEKTAQMTVTKASKKSCQGGDLSRTVIWGISAPLHQATLYLPGNLSGRILYVAWWFFCVIVTAVYTGNLIAFLAVSRSKTPFSTLEELAENEDYAVHVPRGSYIENQLMHSNVTVMKILWQKVLASRILKFNNSIEEYDYHLRLLQSGKYAVIEVRDTLDYLQLTVSQMKRMTEDVLTISMSLPFPLDSPLEAFFSEKIMLLYDSGMLNGLQRKYGTKNHLLHDGPSQTSKLEIGDLQSAVTACAAGVFMAAVCLVVEYIWSNYKSLKWS